MKGFHIQARRGSQREIINGVEYFVSVSPYFFPEELECERDTESGAFTLRFKYMDNEPAKPSPDDADEMIDISVGRHTGRILTIAVQIDQIDTNLIREFVFDRIPKAVKQAGLKLPRAKDNFSFAAEVIAKHAEDLVRFAIR